jgi:hypothetical protein
MHEPNYAIHLEVAEFINTKKANNPREAAMLIARLANHRNPHVSILSLALLDTLVQSCGYPFHLQISTKEFLNELVRRFPERPPPFPGPVMSRILELINGWKEGICMESRWREDLGNVRDMHRLLTFKGYRFRQTPPRQPSLESASNLKSAEELESEDREAQSAKLQELIRRGTPRDLAAAQELMKSLAGANPDSKPDYRTQALADLNKLEQKVVLLNEMLDNADTERGEKLVTGDVYEQVASILSSARPKIQKWISDAETEDPESLDTFLQINDQINTVLNRYEAFKNGDYVTSSNPIPAEFGAGSGANNMSLIDFDDSATSTAVTHGSASEDLSSLFGPPSIPLNTVPMMGMGATLTQTFAPSPMASNGNVYGVNFGAGPGMPPNINAATRPASQHSTPPPQQLGSIMLRGTPPPGQKGTTPNYFSANPVAQGPVVMGGGVGSGMSTVMPQRAQSQPVVQPQSQAPTQAQPQLQQQSPSASQMSQGKDPFADLVGLF